MYTEKRENTKRPSPLQQLALLQTLFEIQQKHDAIERFENEKEANQYIIAATVLIILLLILLAVSIISRQRLKIKNEQKLNEQNQALYEAQKNAMEADLELKKQGAYQSHLASHPKEPAA